jgi:hypothetical protein
MLKTKLPIYFLSFCFSVMAYAQGTASEALAKLREQLVSPWLVSVDSGGRGFERVLVIKGVTANSAGDLVPELEYGLLSGQSPVRGTLAQKDRELKISFVTQADSRIEATQQEDGSFQGTFTDKKGSVMKLRMVKTTKEAVVAFKFPKPNADVPPACAAFFGGWAGTWSVSQGPTRLWVHSIKADCTAMYSYRSTSSDAPPTQYSNTEIKEGVLTSTCGNDGKCEFTRHGDEIWGRYQSGSGTNSGVFRKIQ